jgi:hypothetical protein
LATQIVEYLKTVPANRVVPAQIFTDSVTGASLVDASGGALLDDTAMGDGLLTWHLLRPYGADGTPMAEGSNWTSQSLYLVAYGVEWGGPTGSHFESAAGATNELLLAQYPEIIPGANQIYLEVWVGWVKPGAQFQAYNAEGDGLYEGTEFKNIMDFFNSVDADFPDRPTVFTRRKIALKTLRKF